jgi:hypothetical protein
MPEGPRQDEAHRAIGRYVAHFSRLIAEMREAITYVLAGDESVVARLAFGEATASQIANAFFGICEHLADYDDEERRVAGQLKKEVSAAIKARNDFAHGDWVMAKEAMGKPTLGPTLRRVKPGRKADPITERVFPVEELDALSEDLFWLAQNVGEFAMLCVGGHPVGERLKQGVRIRDIFRIREHQVVRDGRYADEPWHDAE